MLHLSFRPAQIFGAAATAVMVLVVVIGVIMMVRHIAGRLRQRHSIDHVIELGVGGACGTPFHDLAEGIPVHAKGRDLVKQIIAFLQDLGRPLRVCVVGSPRLLIEIGAPLSFRAHRVDRGDQLLHLICAATRARGHRRVNLTRKLSKASVTVRTVVFIDGHKNPQ
jgi:hypothetical protein